MRGVLRIFPWVLIAALCYGAEWRVVRQDDFVRNDGIEGDLLTVHVFKDGTVVAAGSNGLVIRSTDGGKSWEARRIKVEDLGIIFWGGFFFDERTGWIVGRGSRGFGGAPLIFKTDDQGKSWKRLQAPRVPRLLDAFFFDEMNGWVVGETRTLIRTTDGGQSWEVISAARARAGEMRYNYDAIWFPTRKEGWIVGAYGLILHTSDGGQTWREVQLEDVVENLHDVLFVDEKKGWIVGQDGVVLRTTDGGESWRRVDLGEEDELRSIWFASEKLGWIVGDMGTILMTEDGGETWHEVKSPASSSFFAVSGRLNPETKKFVCYVVGEFGVVVKGEGEVK